MAAATAACAAERMALTTEVDRIYFLHDVDEYREIDKKYTGEARRIDNYRMECKDEAFQMFSRWFYALWD